MKILPLLFPATSIAAQAKLIKLIVKLDEPKTTGSKTVVKLTIKNTFDRKVESARATLFLLEVEGKVVGQATQWVIGGTKNNNGLPPDRTATFNFVLSADKPFSSTKVSFSRIVLESGKSVNPAEGVQVEK